MDIITAKVAILVILLGDGLFFGHLSLMIQTWMEKRKRQTEEAQETGHTSLHTTNVALPVSTSGSLGKLQYQLFLEGLAFLKFEMNVGQFPFSHRHIHCERKAIAKWRVG